MDEHIKRWVKVTHSAAGLTTVTVTLLQGSTSVHWTESSFVNSVKESRDLATQRAQRALDDLTQES